MTTLRQQPAAPEPPEQASGVHNARSTLHHLQAALHHAIAARSVRTVARIRLAISSARGAIRAAEYREARETEEAQDDLT